MKKQLVMYLHGGSGNHGCEAIVNSTCNMISDIPVLLTTNSEKEDKTYTLQNLCDILEERKIAEHFLAHVFYYGWRKVMHDPESFMRYRFRDVLGANRTPLYLSIGGDMYCYEISRKEAITANSAFHKAGSKVILWGCSIEPELMKLPEMVQDMKLYDLIVARESLTVEALRKAGVTENVKLYPDPAFSLVKKELSKEELIQLLCSPITKGQQVILQTEQIDKVLRNRLQADGEMRKLLTNADMADGNSYVQADESQCNAFAEALEEGHCVGINISPMILSYGQSDGEIVAAYQALLDYILQTTEDSIALIPHVSWNYNDDRVTLAELYKGYENNPRVMLIPDMDCCSIKYIISKCRLFIGARTHATIAAYSTQVPTLVIGYSVKAKGIARDLFGAEKPYVLPVQELQTSTQLIEAYEWLDAHAAQMKETLSQVMPEYIQQSEAAGNEIRQLWEKAWL